METLIFALVGGLVGLGAGAGGLHIFREKMRKKKVQSARQEAERLIQKARQDAERLDREAKNRARDFEQKARKNVEKDIERQKQTLAATEKQWKEKEKRLDDLYQEKNRKLETKAIEVEGEREKVKIVEARVKDQETQMTQKLGELATKLERVSAMTADQAKKELVEAVRREAEVEASKVAIQIEADAKEQAERKAKRIISMAISRYAGEYVQERTVSVIALPNEDMKGKIIGREGRNIRAMEALCGVDLIIDETPEAVVISGFDPVRREVARRSLEKLMEDGRIHPSRIEEVVEKTKGDLFKSIMDDGQKACYDLGISNVHSEIIKLIGSLKYRTSYTQDNYSHSIEVGFICGMMASEMGLDVHIARRSGFLHDIGKALDHSVEGSHAVIGAEFAKRHGESEMVVHAIRAHHEDEKPNSPYAYLVQAGDALSGARPGARRQMMETYVKRLSDLESIANSFDGVVRTFAIQAGREIRVIVEGSKVTDEQSVMLARDIARKIEREMAYPGQIKVNVIRETRAVEIAR